MKDDLPENDALWAVLAKSRRTTPSPFFARNVLREIRRSTPPAPLQFWFRWLAPAAYALLAVGFFLSLETASLPTAKSTEPPPIDILELIDETPAPTEFTPAHLAGL